MAVVAEPEASVTRRFSNGLQAQLSSDVDEVPPDGMTADQQLTAVAKQIVELEERIERLEDRIDAVLRRLGGKEPT